MGSLRQSRAREARKMGRSRRREIFKSTRYSCSRGAVASSLRVSAGPFVRGFVVRRAVVQELLRDAPDERVVGVRVREQRADGEQHLGDGERGRPLLLQDVQADAPLRVHVRVVHLCLEVHLRGLERVVGGELSFGRGGEGKNRKGSGDGSGPGSGALSLGPLRAKILKNTSTWTERRASMPTPLFHRQIAGEESLGAATGSATGGRRGRGPRRSRAGVSSARARAFWFAFTPDVS